MSNYYKSDCCGEQVENNGIKGLPLFKCLKCECPCEVTAMIDKPGGVPEALKANVDKLNKHKCLEDHNGNCYTCGRSMLDKTEQIKREWLDFLERQVIDAGVIDIFSNPLKSPIGNKVADWWLQKLSEQRQEVIDDYQTNYEQQHIASAIKVARQSILEEVEKLSKELETIDIRDILKKLK